MSDGPPRKAGSLELAEWADFCVRLVGLFLCIRVVRALL